MSFNPRARGGRDYDSGNDSCSRRDVSIHAPAGGATDSIADSYVRFKVSIHAPAGGATFDLKTEMRLWAFQSTRPRGARLKPKHKSVSQKHVSIHAPAGGATDSIADSYVRFKVSIHAPAGGATIKKFS